MSIEYQDSVKNGTGYEIWEMGIEYMSIEI